MLSLKQLLLLQVDKSINESMAIDRVSSESITLKRKKVLK